MSVRGFVLNDPSAWYRATMTQAPDFAYRLCAERFQASGAAAVPGRVWRNFARRVVQRILKSLPCTNTHLNPRSLNEMAS
jgi:hypothetical protein